MACALIECKTAVPGKEFKLNFKIKRDGTFPIQERGGRWGGAKGGVGIEFIYMEGNHLSLLLWNTWLQVPVTDFLYIYLFIPASPWWFSSFCFRRYLYTVIKLSFYNMVFSSSLFIRHNNAVLFCINTHFQHPFK